MAPYTKAQIFTYGLNSKADLWANKIQTMGLSGVRFNLHYGRENLQIHVPLLGQHNVHTCLRAAAVGLVEGLNWEEIIAGLQKTQAQVRLLTITGPRNSLIIDDTYNSSPDSVMAALNLLHDLDGRHVAVLGDMLELGHVEKRSSLSCWSASGCSSSGINYSWATGALDWRICLGGWYEGQSGYLS